MIKILKAHEFKIQLLCWALLFGLDLFFYQARSTHSDCSIVVVEFMFKKGFIIVHNRYTNLIFQFLPIIWLKCGGNLKGLLMILSVSIHLIIFIGFLALHFICKDLKYGWLILLSMFFWTNHSYIYLTPESSTFIICLFYFSIFDYYKNHKFGFAYFIICSVLFISVVFAHPISLLLMCIVFLYLILTEYKKHLKPILLSIAYLFILVIIVKINTPPIAYDNKNIFRFIENLSKYNIIGSSALNQVAFKYYIKNITYQITIGLVAIALIISRDWMRLGFFIIISIFIHCILSAYLFDLNSLTYCDLYYQVLGIIYCLLIYYCIEKFNAFSYFPFIILILISFFRIFDIGNIYNKRIEYINKVMTYCQSLRVGDKISIPHSVISGDKLYNESWVFQCETLILSTLRNKPITISLSSSPPSINTGKEFYMGDLPWVAQDGFINPKTFPLSQNKYYLLDSLPPF